MPGPDALLAAALARDPAGPLVIETRSRAETGVHKVGIDPAACHLFTEEGRCVSLYRN